MSRVIVGTVVLALLVASVAPAQPASARDSAAAVATVAKFHASLAAGDSVAALALLSDNVQILETGGIENRTQYREHHLAGDIAYAKSAPSQRTVNQVTVRGDVAWIVSTSTTTGEASGRPVNSLGAELIVLVRADTGWKITAVHWSSRRRTP